MRKVLRSPTPPADDETDEMHFPAAPVQLLLTDAADKISLKSNFEVLNVSFR